MKNFTTHFMFSSAHARKGIMLLTAVLFFVGYYYVLHTPIGIIREIRIISIAALLCLCVFGSIFLLANSEVDRSRKIFALQMLLVACAAGFTLMRIISGEGTPASSSQIVTPGVLLYGNSFAFILLLFPFEQLSLQRITLWGYGKLFLPALLCGLFFYGYVGLGGQTTDLKNWQVLSGNFHRFDVWFRIVLLIYPLWLFTRILYQKKRYIIWYSRNFSNTECIDLAWLDYYLFGYFLILGSYLVVILTGNRQSLVMHSLVFLLFFAFAFYHILRPRTSLDLSDFSTEDATDSSEVEIYPDSAQTVCSTTETGNDKYRFVDKIPHYKIDLERWMHEQKPYKNKEFKLLDVMQVLPLNRSYISRLFNEGYGETFFDYVMRYRLEESIRLMEEHPEMNIRRISDLCGFSSPSVFGRAFLKNKGVTPKQYRRDMDIEI